MELLDWLNTHTFPEEMKYADADYAKKAYTMFVEDLKKSAVTRAVIFATLHIEGTKILMDLLEASGLDTYVGKVSMDRNALEGLQEENAEAAAKAVRQWLLETEGRYEHTKPILTPRFIPSCSDALMAELKSIQEKQDCLCSLICQKIREKFSGYRNFAPILPVTVMRIIRQACSEEIVLRLWHIVSG